MHKRQNKGIIEIIIPKHVEPEIFVSMCNERGLFVDPSSVKNTHEAMRYEDKEIKYIECDKHTRGAYKVTKGIIK